MTLLAELPPDVSVRSACDALGQSRATLYRRRGGQDDEDRPRTATGRRPMPAPPRQLDVNEREAVVALLHSEQFADQPPREIVSQLLSEGRYVC